MPRSSGRSQKVGDQIQRELSEIIHRELRDPRVGLITLTSVDVSSDCAYATVYFTCLDADHVKEAVAGLRRATGFLRTQLGKRVKLWMTPELKFVYDESVERGDRLSRLIDKANRDPAKPPEPTEG
ncbi:MAG: 30S ribosome-binding factor RbfA [Betaproteobacteria bacterium]